MNIPRCSETFGLFFITLLTTITPLIAIHCQYNIFNLSNTLLFILSIFSTSICLETGAKLFPNILVDIVKALITVALLFYVFSYIRQLFQTEEQKLFIQSLATIIYGLDIRRYFQSYFN